MSRDNRTVQGRSILLASLLLLLIAPLRSDALDNEVIQGKPPQSTMGEVLIAQFTAGPVAVTSQQAYSGQVTITVAGIGQASATAYSDAFYILTDNAGVPVTPWRPNTYYNWLLWINGQHAESLIPNQQVPVDRWKGSRS